MGTAIQVAIFLTPAVATFSWFRGQLFTLNFNTSAAVMLLFSVWIVSLLLRDGRSNCLKGTMCVGM